MVWGTDSGEIDKERLEPLGLTCWGGGSGTKIWGNKDKDKIGMTYHVFNEDKSFDFELSYKDFQNIDKIYKEWKLKIRKEKLKKLKND